MSEFQENYDSLVKEGGLKMKEFLDSINPQCWACLFFPTQRYGQMTSALSESFNSWIRDERTMPITAMLDHIRLKLMEMMLDRCLESKSGNSVLCPAIETDLGNTVVLVSIGR
ncbi:hypothetical protein BVC80_1317g2 [Macleaya cordata]|uniref:Uncharacterized protein n=1 Tax=Macleaya cordata TaxID=56857 RepID=A0A200QZ45_MACCD|nr:hypothetical protein BVC80_1317g2 [Macleaya cordata]